MSRDYYKNRIGTTLTPVTIATTSPRGRGESAARSRWQEIHTADDHESLGDMSRACRAALIQSLGGMTYGLDSLPVYNGIWLRTADKGGRARLYVSLGDYAHETLVRAYLESALSLGGYGLGESLGGYGLDTLMSQALATYPAPLDAIQGGSVAKTKAYHTIQAGVKALVLSNLIEIDA